MNLMILVGSLDLGRSGLKIVGHKILDGRYLYFGIPKLFLNFFNIMLT